MLESMGLSTGVDLSKLLAIRDLVREALPDIEMHGAIAKAGLPQHFDQPGRRQRDAELI
jgi:hydroxymethylglutaryl-CoA lyase